MHSWHPSLSCLGSSGKTTILYSLNQSCITKVISKGWAWVDAGNKKLWNFDLLAVSPQVLLVFLNLISFTIGLPLVGLSSFLCSAEEGKSCSFKMAWGWQNFHFCEHYPFKQTVLMLSTIRKKITLNLFYILDSKKSHKMECCWRRLFKGE